MEKAKRVVWRLLAASVCVMAVSQAVHADSLDEQRNRYAQIKQAWDNKQMDTVAGADADAEGLSAVSVSGVSSDH